MPLKLLGTGEPSSLIFFYSNIIYCMVDKLDFMGYFEKAFMKKVHYERYSWTHCSDGKHFEGSFQICAFKKFKKARRCACYHLFQMHFHFGISYFFFSTDPIIGFRSCF